MASHVCSSRYGRLPCIRTCFALVPAYRSLASLIHPDSQTQVWSTKAEGTLSQAGTLARSSLRLACPPLRALHLPHFFHTLPAAPCCTWPSRLHSQFLHPAVCTHPGHLHLAIQRRPFESRPHVPPVDTTQDPGMHLRVRSPARYRTTTVCPSTDTLPGHGTEPGRARPSPLRVNHDLPCHALHRSLP